MTADSQRAEAAPKPPLARAAPTGPPPPSQPRTAVQMLKGPETARSGPTRLGMARPSTARPGMVRHGTARHGPPAGHRLSPARVPGPGKGVPPVAVPGCAVPSPTDRPSPEPGWPRQPQRGARGAQRAGIGRGHRGPLPSVSTFPLVFTESHTFCTACSLCCKAQKALPKNPQSPHTPIPPGTPLLRFRPLLFLPAFNLAPNFYLRFTPPMPRSGSGESLAAPMNTQGSPDRFSM